MHEGKTLTAEQIAADQARESRLNWDVALECFEQLDTSIKTATPNDPRIEALITQMKSCLVKVDVSDRLAFVEHMMLHLYVLLTTLATDLRRDFSIGSTPDPAQSEPAQAEPTTPA